MGSVASPPHAPAQSQVSQVKKRQEGSILESALPEVSANPSSDHLSKPIEATVVGQVG